MNLYEMLDNYKTNPSNEMGKIWKVLNFKYGYTTLWMALGESFQQSVFCSYEPTLDSFYSKVIISNDCYDGVDDFEKTVLQYRFFTELLINLLQIGMPSFSYGEFDNHINQLNSLIVNGLERCGYGLKKVNGNYVTYKIDVVAETIASENKKYTDDIYDYLLAKTTTEKEKALTSLSIKLEVTKPIDKFTNNARDYIQMMRHKEERKGMKQYAWFFDGSSYKKNLDDLFRILICYISHIESAETIKKYDDLCHIK